ncbi:MAG: sigma-54-dependent Fis family transcriptional regulator [Candidatus Dadabacteria bacterium]|nr:sigma-54-dependent Fis family transcriptional regulator [Candidatus Dadabacteria bacterium]NIS08607.1 sigma-54-dependent Fis family transcriptional regulator [Candidatus Dadabacteria bacterium]NIV42390.1 response regulator [Candidatus Dadabacteria bacterium]NIY22312.1 response regulator [Candidatus Dadabacteria bacterium]
MSTVLIVDDEPGVRESMSLILKMEGYTVDTVRDAVHALKLLDTGKNYDFIISDIKMPEMDGLEFLAELKKRESDSIIIMISAYGTIESSMKAIKFGAYDYINKPVNTDELILRMKMSEERKKLRRENVALKKELRKEFGFEDIVYKDSKMKEIIELASKVSDYKTTVLITGESGTGKELIARSVHANSSRKDKPFVALNCAAIPENLLESELFGYEAGAFSGANKSKPGLFEEADGGTLFLDEIGEFPLSLQPKLLRALQDEEIRRLGGTKTKTIDVRILAATSRNLAEQIEENQFRADLFYRLNVMPIEIPPLRERTDDIPALVDYFIDKYNEKLGSNVKGVTKKVLDQLISCPWAGNVRELENVIEKTMILNNGDIVDEVQIAPRDEQIDPKLWIGSLKLDEAMSKLEKLYIEKALSQTGGNRTKAAEALGISRRGLLYKIKEYGLGVDNDRED